MLETIFGQCNLPGDDTDHTSAVFDRERDVMLNRGCGYEVSGMNTQGVTTVLKKPNYFFSYPTMINNTAQRKVII